MIAKEKKIQAQIDIHASTEQVWNCLTTFEDFPEWNPFICSARGKLTTGQKLSMRLQIPGGPPMIIRPKLTVVNPPHQLCWLGSLLWPGLFDGEHQLIIKPLYADCTRLIQQEIFSGFLVPFLGGLLSRAALSGFEAMNQAMKTRLENT